MALIKSTGYHQDIIKNNNIKHFAVLKIQMEGRKQMAALAETGKKSMFELSYFTWILPL